jgi:hypothetical protein
MEVLEGLKDAAMGNAPVQGSELVPTGEESRGADAAGVVDVAGGGCGGLLQA